MENFIILAIVILIIVGIAIYLIRAKKRGQTCIGCPYAKQCSGKCNTQSCNSKNRSNSEFENNGEADNTK